VSLWSTCLNLYFSQGSFLVLFIAGLGLSNVMATVFGIDRPLDKKQSVSMGLPFPVSISVLVPDTDITVDFHRKL